jgi:hypothetical protein
MIYTILAFTIGCLLVLAWTWEANNPFKGMNRHDDQYDPFQ